MSSGLAALGSLVARPVSWQKEPASASMSKSQVLEKCTLATLFSNKTDCSKNLDRWLFKAPEYDVTAIPVEQTPYIPINYYSERVQSDKAQQIGIKHLWQFNSLTTITPESMKDQVVMQGTFYGAPFHLIRIITSEMNKQPVESVLIFVENDGDTFVHDTKNYGLKSYHPHSPFKLAQIKSSILDLVNSDKTKGAELAFSRTERKIKILANEKTITLWSPTPQNPELPFTYRVLNWSPAVAADPLKMNQQIIAIRTAIVFFTFFMLMQYFTQQLTPAAGTAVITATANQFWERRKARHAIEDNAIEIYRKSAPSEEVLKIIASSERAIEKVCQEKLNLEKPGPDLRTLLCHCPTQQLEDLLIQNGAQVSNFHSTNTPLLTALRTDDLERVYRFMQALSTRKLNPLEEKNIVLHSTMNSLFAALEVRPKLNLNASTSPEVQSTFYDLLEEVRSKRILNEEDRKRMQDTINKINYMLRHGIGLDDGQTFFRALKEHAQKSLADSMRESVTPERNNLQSVNSYALIAVSEEILNVIDETRNKSIQSVAKTTSS